ncbi:cathepsin propeptide inhibitor domain protein, partial [Oesophagostomum dentatum]
MWPKWDKKSTHIDFQPLESPRVEIRAGSRVRFLEKLVDVAVILAQCLLVIAILFSLLKIFVIFHVGYLPAQNDQNSGTLGPAEPRLVAMFEDFMKSYNKAYVSVEEVNYRFSVFVKNVMYFEEEEKKNPGLDLDVTRFADWTEEEMRK